MGVLVFLLAIIPLSGGSNINLMRAESPGPSVGKLVPKMRHTARLLYIIYFGLTTMEIIFLLFGKMPLYDAICTLSAQPVQEASVSKTTVFAAIMFICNGLLPYL